MLLLSRNSFKNPSALSCKWWFTSHSQWEPLINLYQSALISAYSLTFYVLGACLLIFTYHCPALWGEHTTLALQDHKKKYSWRECSSNRGERCLPGTITNVGASWRSHVDPPYTSSPLFALLSQGEEGKLDGQVSMYVLFTVFLINIGGGCARGGFQAQPGLMEAF